MTVQENQTCRIEVCMIDIRNFKRSKKRRSQSLSLTIGRERRGIEWEKISTLRSMAIIGL